MARLSRRADYLQIAKGLKAARPSLVVQAKPLARACPPVAGFTATKKVGNAVVRNRARRRLKEAARRLLPALGRPGVGYVFIARDTTAAATWPCLLDDMKSALLRLAAQLDAGPTVGAGGRPSHSRPASPRSAAPGSAEAPASPPSSPSDDDESP